MGRRNSWGKFIAVLFVGFGCASSNAPSVFHPSAAFVEQAKTSGCSDAICASIITTEALARTVFANEKVDQTKIKFVCLAGADGVERLGSVCPSFRYKYTSLNNKESGDGVIQGSNPSITVRHPSIEYDIEISTLDGTARQKLTAVKGGQTVRLQFK